jgi:plasmid stability protein
VAVNLSIKNVPDNLAAQLRARAKANNRSLQGELMSLLQEAVAAPSKLTASDVLERIRAAKLRSPREAAAMIRSDRNAR